MHIVFLLLCSSVFKRSNWKFQDVKYATQNYTKYNWELILKFMPLHFLPYFERKKKRFLTGHFNISMSILSTIKHCCKTENSQTITWNLPSTCNFPCWSWRNTVWRKSLNAVCTLSILCVPYRHVTKVFAIKRKYNYVLQQFKNIVHGMANVNTESIYPYCKIL